MKDSMLTQFIQVDFIILQANTLQKQQVLLRSHLNLQGHQYIIQMDHNSNPARQTLSHQRSPSGAGGAHKFYKFQFHPGFIAEKQLTSSHNFEKPPQKLVKIETRKPPVVKNIVFQKYPKSLNSSGAGESEVARSSSTSNYNFIRAGAGAKQEENGSVMAAEAQLQSLSQSKSRISKLLKIGNSQELMPTSSPSLNIAKDDLRRSETPQVYAPLNGVNGSSIGKQDLCQALDLDAWTVEEEDEDNSLGKRERVNDIVGNRTDEGDATFRRVETEGPPQGFTLAVNRFSFGSPKNSQEEQKKGGSASLNQSQIKFNKPTFHSSVQIEKSANPSISGLNQILSKFSEVKINKKMKPSPSQQQQLSQLPQLIQQTPSRLTNNEKFKSASPPSGTPIKYQNLIDSNLDNNVSKRNEGSKQAYLNIPRYASHIGQLQSTPQKFIPLQTSDGTGAIFMHRRLNNRSRAGLSEAKIPVVTVLSQQQTIILPSPSQQELSQHREWEISIICDNQSTHMVHIQIQHTISLLLSFTLLQYFVHYGSLHDQYVPSSYYLSFYYTFLHYLQLLLGQAMQPSLVWCYTHMLDWWLWKWRRSFSRHCLMRMDSHVERFEGRSFYHAS